MSHIFSHVVSLQAQFLRRLSTFALFNLNNNISLRSPFFWLGCLYMSPFVFRKLLRVGKSSMSLFFHKFLFNKDHTGGSLLSPSVTNTQSMSRTGLFDFSTRTPNRYWWFQQPSNLYLPLIFSHLTSQELLLMRQWYDDTDRIPLHGEMNVPAMSIIYGLISGSSINSIVQLGHYSGWSTLLLGFLLRSMGKSKSFVSFDIDDKMTIYTKTWISRAGLTDYAEALTYDSSSANAVNAADQFLGTRPKLLIIDSSHTYEHTIKELDLWWPQIQPGGASSPTRCKHVRSRV